MLCYYNLYYLFSAFADKFNQVLRPRWVTCCICLLSGYKSMVLRAHILFVVLILESGAAAYEKSEESIICARNNIPIDTKYYLENQLL